MRMILIDTENNSSRIIETEGGLENYYKLLNCDLIDITERKIDGQYFDIICDDEGLFKEGNQVSAVSEDGRPQLVGSLLICNHDGEGGESGLSDEDLEKVSKRLAIATSPDGEKYHVIVIDSEVES